MVRCLKRGERQGSTEIHEGESLAIVRVFPSYTPRIAGDLEIL